jgi:hypothetical protein
MRATTSFDYPSGAAEAAKIPSPRLAERQCTYLLMFVQHRGNISAAAWSNKSYASRAEI